MTGSAICELRGGLCCASSFVCIGVNVELRTTLQPLAETPSSLFFVRQNISDPIPHVF